MREVTVKLHEIAVDGLPDMEGGEFTGRVAFIWDGSIVSGWPLGEPDDEGVSRWEANSDVGHGCAFESVTHWVEFPEPMWDLEKPRDA